MTWFLIGVGGVVTSHGVGMAVPDWPNTYGYNMFYFPFSQWIGGIFWEHSHRLVASLLGLMTLILTIWSQGVGGRKLLRYVLFPLALLVSCLILVRVEQNAMQHISITGGVAMVSLVCSFFWPRMPAASPLVRRLCWLALLLVIVQGLLGGLRVTLYKDEIGIFHATLAQLFLVLMVVLAFSSSRAWSNWKQVSNEALAPARLFSWLMCFCCVLTVAQLALGAFMRHEHAGLAVTGFPLAYDSHLWPPISAEFVDQLNVQRIDHREFDPITVLHVKVHMFHRLMALILFLSGVSMVIWSYKRFGSRHPLSKLCIVWFGLLCLQVLLGAATVWSNKAADIATVHVLIGALTLAHGSFMVLAARRSVYLAVQAAERDTLDRVSHEGLNQVGISSASL